MRKKTNPIGSGSNAMGYSGGNVFESGCNGRSSGLFKRNPSRRHLLMQEGIFLVMLIAMVFGEAYQFFYPILHFSGIETGSLAAALSTNPLAVIQVVVFSFTVVGMLVLFADEVMKRLARVRDGLLGREKTSKMSIVWDAVLGFFFAGIFVAVAIAMGSFRQADMEGHGRFFSTLERRLEIALQPDAASLCFIVLTMAIPVACAILIAWMRDLRRKRLEYENSCCCPKETASS